MSNRALIIIGFIVMGTIVATGTIWYLRSRDAGVPVYNPFQSTEQAAETEEYDPPSDLSSEYDQYVPITTNNSAGVVDPITLPSGLTQ